MYASFVISEEQILRVLEQKAGQSFHCLPTLYFVITHKSKNDHLLTQWIDRQGAVVVDGKHPPSLFHPPTTYNER